MKDVSDPKKTNGGVTTDSEYPYFAQAGTCHYTTKFSSVKVHGALQFPNDQAAIKSYVA